MLATMFLTSCEEAENQILRMWLMKSLEITVTEDDELKVTSTHYFGEEEGIRGEFRDLERSFYEGRERGLVQTYFWVIDNNNNLIISRENLDDTEFEILALPRKDMLLLDEENQTDGNVLSVIERKYVLERLEE